MTETIDLQAFCATESIQASFLRPFAVDGYTVATNGQIMIRVPGVADGVEELTDKSKLADSVRKLFARQYDDFVPLPAIPKRKACEECKGTGRLAEDDCDDCNGMGTFTHGRHEYECEECEGTGRIKDVYCFKCNGQGEPFTSVQVGADKFQAKFLRMIAGLPGVRISVPGGFGTAAFVFDGGDGRLMPCSG